MMTTAWPADVASARSVQRSLVNRVRIQGRWEQLPTLVAGLDVAFPEGGACTRAAIVVLEYPSGRWCTQVVHEQETTFPYVPGYLSFREAPALLAAWQQLKCKPQLLLCDGQGIAHPRRFGIASHLGVLLNLPAIGVAKSRLMGVADEPGPEKGERTPLLDGDEQLGWMLRSRRGVKPLFVSPGHLLDVESAAELTLAACTRYRLPEPIRLADKLSKIRT